MSLKFIIGTASYDHHQTLVKQLQTDLKATNTDRFFYLVPNHIKFESEVALLNDLKTLEVSMSQPHASKSSH